MGLFKYFTLEEFLTSETAVKNKIENLPSFEIVENIKELAAFLDDVRDAWGSGIIVSSGFRCEKLNKKVGGKAASLHKKGLAADLQPTNGDFKGFKKFFADYLKDKKFDELIIEKSGSDEWLHFQIRSNTGEQRRKIFSLVV